MNTNSMTDHQMSLFGEGKQITDIELNSVIDHAHRLRSVALAAHFQAAINFVRRKYLAYATTRTLNSLSDHILNDIGIQRDQIPGIARRVARGETAVSSVVMPTAASAVVLDIASKDSNEDQPDLPLAA